MGGIGSVKSTASSEKDSNTIVSSQLGLVCDIQ